MNREIDPNVIDARTHICRLKKTVRLQKARANAANARRIRKQKRALRMYDGTSLAV